MISSFASYAVLRKKILAVFFFALFFASPAVSLEAKMGKVFFSSTDWVKGDILFQKDSKGRDYVVIVFDTGSMTVPRSKVKNIVYPPVKHVSPRTAKFLRAFNNTLSNTTASKSPALYESYIKAASAKYKIDPELVKAIIKQESNFKHDDVSSKGAQGLMQLMPGTARNLGVTDSFDPWENIHGGVRYFRMMLENFNGDIKKALAAYNAGPGAVAKYGAVPPYEETRTYVKKVLEYYGIYRGKTLVSYEDKEESLSTKD